MKTKRYISALLCMLLCFCLMPTTAFAAGDLLVVNGVNILQAPDYTVECGTGKAVYDPDTQTLTLENAVLDQNYNMGRYMLNHLIDNSTDHGITINLIGDNVLGADVEWVSYGIWSDGDLAITGEGTLTVYANNACVFSSGELKIDGATVDVIGQNDYGIASFRSNIIIQNNAHVTGSNCAAILITDYDYGGYINIISSTVNIEATADGNGIVSANNLVIEKSSVEAASGYPALFSYNDIIIKDSKVKAVSTKNWGMWAMNDLLIQGSSTVTSQGEVAALGAANSFKLIPTEEYLVDVFVGATESEASKIGNSPLSEETDLSSYGNNAIQYFHSELHQHVYDQQNVSDKYKAADATCENAAQYYYSCVCGEAGTETFLQGDSIGHTWDEPVWSWAEDYSSASVTFTCQNDGNHTESPDVTIDSVTTDAACTADGKIVYTASVTFNGETYTDEQTVVISAIGHQADTKWESDDASHWNKCTVCGEKLNESVHTFEWIIDKEATEAEAGSKHEECTVCNYAKEAVEIPATGAATGDQTNPGTGDNSNITLYISLMLAAGVALTGTTIYSRKRKYSN